MFCALFAAAPKRSPTAVRNEHSTWQYGSRSMFFGVLFIFLLSDARAARDWVLVTIHALGKNTSLDVGGGCPFRTVHLTVLLHCGMCGRRPTQ